MRVLGIAVVCAALLFATAPAGAVWKTGSARDRMSDKDSTWVYVIATKPDRGIGASIVIRCMDDPVVGGLYVELKTSAKFSRGRLGLRYRVDDGEPQNRYMPINSNGDGMSLFARPNDLAAGKRMRLELQPAGSSNLFFEFDISGAREAFQSIPCRETHRR
jgi:hypothetical protein